jgi:hypothetical protein
MDLIIKHKNGDHYEMGRRLILTPEKTFTEVGQLDLLHVPGGPGQEALMGILPNNLHRPRTRRPDFARGYGGQAVH